ncbi:hypothetical protein A6B38_05970 [Bartonella bacilliformis]|uniref:Uncharacterized protein n=2 Tax=Bartonella bacilliformis TaxID=774 RepID=A1URH5_BARBK|nr:hypothetical protein BARBAKC583_0245 [Bartonella bacilliformis KC583]AMG85442.1 hypothetical protein AL467_01265 [Bartonella bacilliformis]EKS45878.1 hypothetical protein BbINS_01156 [Bartonella bacilliformis INS]KZN21346.1 hypothetical protein A6B38_05970 [Bartonella bacilliformis]QFZ90025.1 hypothetical protein GHC17_01050 [Bartonella bacilliformis]
MGVSATDMRNFALKNVIFRWQREGKFLKGSKASFKILIIWRLLGFLSLKVMWGLRCGRDTFKKESYFLSKIRRG